MKISPVFKPRNDLHKQKVQIHYGKKKTLRSDFKEVLNECMVTRED